MNVGLVVTASLVILATAVTQRDEQQHSNMSSSVLAATARVSLNGAAPSMNCDNCGTERVSSRNDSNKLYDENEGLDKASLQNILHNDRKVQAKAPISDIIFHRSKIQASSYTNDNSSKLQTRGALISTIEDANDINGSSSYEPKDFFKNYSLISLSSESTESESDAAGLLESQSQSSRLHLTRGFKIPTLSPTTLNNVRHLYSPQDKILFKPYLLRTNKDEEVEQIITNTFNSNTFNVTTSNQHGQSMNFGRDITQHKEPNNKLGNVSQIFNEESEKPSFQMDRFHRMVMALSESNPALYAGLRLPYYSLSSDENFSNWNGGHNVYSSYEHNFLSDSQDWKNSKKSFEMDANDYFRTEVSITNTDESNRRPVNYNSHLPLAGYSTAQSRMGYSDDGRPQVRTTPSYDMSLGVAFGTRKNNVLNGQETYAVNNNFGGSFLSVFRNAPSSSTLIATTTLPPQKVSTREVRSVKISGSATAFPPRLHELMRNATAANKSSELLRDNEGYGDGDVRSKVLNNDLTGQEPSLTLNNNDLIAGSSSFNLSIISYPDHEPLPDSLPLISSAGSGSHALRSQSIPNAVRIDPDSSVFQSDRVVIPTQNIQNNPISNSNSEHNMKPDDYEYYEDYYDYSITPPNTISKSLLSNHYSPDEFDVTVPSFTPAHANLYNLKELENIKNSNNFPSHFSVLSNVHNLGSQQKGNKQLTSQPRWQEYSRAYGPFHAEHGNEEHQNAFSQHSSNIDGTDVNPNFNLQNGSPEQLHNKNMFSNNNALNADRDRIIQTSANNPQHNAEGSSLDDNGLTSSYSSFTYKSIANEIMGSTPGFSNISFLLSPVTVKPYPMSTTPLLEKEQNGKYSSSDGWNKQLYNKSNGNSSNQENSFQASTSFADPSAFRPILLDANSVRNPTVSQFSTPIRIPVAKHLTLTNHQGISELNLPNPENKLIQLSHHPNSFSYFPYPRVALPQLEVNTQTTPIPHVGINPLQFHSLPHFSESSPTHTSSIDDGDVVAHRQLTTNISGDSYSFSESVLNELSHLLDLHSVSGQNKVQAPHDDFTQTPFPYTSDSFSEATPATVEALNSPYRPHPHLAQREIAQRDIIRFDGTTSLPVDFNSIGTITHGNSETASALTPQHYISNNPYINQAEISYNPLSNNNMQLISNNVSKQLLDSSNMHISSHVNINDDKFKTSSDEHAYFAISPDTILPQYTPITLSNYTLLRPVNNQKNILELLNKTPHISKYIPQNYLQNPLYGDLGREINPAFVLNQPANGLSLYNSFYHDLPVPSKNNYAFPQLQPQYQQYFSHPRLSISPQHNPYHHMQIPIIFPVNYNGFAQHGFDNPLLHQSYYGQPKQLLPEPTLPLIVNPALQTTANFATKIEQLPVKKLKEILMDDQGRLSDETFFENNIYEGIDDISEIKQLPKTNSDIHNSSLASTIETSTTSQNSITEEVSTNNEIDQTNLQPTTFGTSTAKTENFTQFSDWIPITDPNTHLDENTDVTTVLSKPPELLNEAGTSNLIEDSKTTLSIPNFIDDFISVTPIGNDINETSTNTLKVDLATIEELIRPHKEPKDDAISVFTTFREALRGINSNPSYFILPNEETRKLQPVEDESHLGKLLLDNPPLTEKKQLHNDNAQMREFLLILSESEAGLLPEADEYSIVLPNSFFQLSKNESFPGKELRITGNIASKQPIDALQTSQRFEDQRDVAGKYSQTTSGQIFTGKVELKPLSTTEYHEKNKKSINASTSTKQIDLNKADSINFNDALKFLETTMGILTDDSRELLKQRFSKDDMQIHLDTPIYLWRSGFNEGFGMRLLDNMHFVLPMEEVGAVQKNTKETQINPKDNSQKQIQVPTRSKTINELDSNLFAETTVDESDISNTLELQTESDEYILPAFDELIGNCNTTECDNNPFDSYEDLFKKINSAAAKIKGKENKETQIEMTLNYDYDQNSDISQAGKNSSITRVRTIDSPDRPLGISSLKYVKPTDADNFITELEKLFSLTRNEKLQSTHSLSTRTPDSSTEVSLIAKDDREPIKVRSIKTGNHNTHFFSSPEVLNSFVNETSKNIARFGKHINSDNTFSNNSGMRSMTSSEIRDWNKGLTQFSLNHEQPKENVNILVPQDPIYLVNDLESSESLQSFAVHDGQSLNTILTKSSGHASTFPEFEDKMTNIGDTVTNGENRIHLPSKIEKLVNLFSEDDIQDELQVSVMPDSNDLNTLPSFTTDFSKTSRTGREISNRNFEPNILPNELLQQPLLTELHSNIKEINDVRTQSVSSQLTQVHTDAPTHSKELLLVRSSESTEDTRSQAYKDKAHAYSTSGKIKKDVSPSNTNVNLESPYSVSSVLLFDKNQSTGKNATEGNRSWLWQKDNPDSIMKMDTHKKSVDKLQIGEFVPIPGPFVPEHVFVPSRLTREQLDMLLAGGLEGTPASKEVLLTSSSENKPANIKVPSNKQSPRIGISDSVQISRNDGTFDALHNNSHVVQVMPSRINDHRKLRHLPGASPDGWRWYGTQSNTNKMVAVGNRRKRELSEIIRIKDLARGLVASAPG